ncbi:HAD family hydrolase [Bifidobacterium gallicum]|uniref:HAD family hydrolase n=1 Tax=Bifidobacterium gallicum DSM 20093 = LMG 11596 TaxID=561180 RepID=D1NVP3_9BIFI|nr:HAD family phosphatase [Bifidobacterium gallicum]EFA22894.1 HAD hydrolase, family IA, variant 3 [Bifidobacterium gallicum DSM 20093 = LMG 11596]KFI59404.1 HAD family hydrolase [Bifidobacterium gallicum DSM 20093 = LMG 11596]
MELLKAVFWDMDGTLIDSEPYWHEGEMRIAQQYGGYWDEALAWQGSGTPVPEVAARMVEHGCPLSINEISHLMITHVIEAERERIPWFPGVERLLELLRDAGVPNVLVTTSPRQMAENLIAQAPAGAFAGYVCGDDDVAKKPDPAPYLLAASKLGIAREHMALCVAMEDSISGLTSAAASGATTVAQTGYIQADNSDGPQFASINGYANVTPELLESFVRERLSAMQA